MAQTYLVGGAVRDKLLGRESKDNDYVVVGSTSQEMLDQGFQQVGADFPVFLHPVTGDEYALARQERKNGKGYHGFAVSADPSITIEEDLLRRDLTINAMAMTENDQLIDPYGGYKDLQAGVLRHTSEAFGDDPLRVLRLARFTARYTEFYVAEETISLCKTMIARGDLVDLSKERIVAELFKGFGEKDPERMMLFLWDCDAQFHAPLNEYFGDGAFAAVSLLAGREEKSTPEEYMMFARRWSNFKDDDAGKEIARLKLPNTVTKLVQAWNHIEDGIRVLGGDPDNILDGIARFVEATKFESKSRAPTVDQAIALHNRIFKDTGELFKARIELAEKLGEALRNVPYQEIVEASPKDAAVNVKAAKQKAINDFKMVHRFLELK